ncbi:hypothetical protein [Sorangium sp. So ce385]|uniref:hypothetical protein n=1 Tax=Sorangium sp. So ce385 TaxID=3133308 RepID=UPI003F5B398F
MTLSPRHISWAVGPLALLVHAGCGGAVIMDGGGDGAGGAGGAGSTTTAAVGPSPTPHPPPTPDPPPTTSGSPSPEVSAIVYGDATVTIRIASLALSCSDPEARPTFSPCGDWWNLELRMPASRLAVGEVDTASGDFTIYGTSSRADCSSTGAATGGGDVGFGRLTITAIEPTSVTFELDGVGSLFLDQDPNGRYVAARCAAR